MAQSNFDTLSKILFEGDNKAADFKTMPGKSEDISRERAAKSLLDSMERMGIVKDGSLVQID